MRALRWHAVGDLRVDEIEEPSCSKGEVKVRPEYVGICGTDLTEFVAGPIVIASTTHPVTGQKAPVTMGHEISATVEEIGSDVHNVKRGSLNCCYQFGSLGFSGPGGMSEYVVVPQENVFKLPDNLSLEEGALVEPLTVAWHAVGNSNFQPGDDALVVGAGPVGLAVIQVLRARGARKIVVSELSSRRQELAKSYGATDILDPKDPNVVTMCKQITGGEGPAVAFDVAGVQAGLDLALAATRTGATIVNIAFWHVPAQVNTTALLMGEKKYVGTMVHLQKDFGEVIEAMASGAIQAKSMISEVVALEDTLEKGFKRLLAEKDSLVKVLVKVQS